MSLLLCVDVASAVPNSTFLCISHFLPFPLLPTLLPLAKSVVVFVNDYFPPS